MSSFQQIRTSPVGRAVGESLPFILPVVMLAALKICHEILPGKVFVGVLLLLSIFIYMSIGREPSLKAAEDDLSSKSRRAQSIAQELEREAATEEAARERKKSAADKKKKNNKGQQQRQEQGGNKGPGAAAAGASVEEEDEDDMLLRLAKKR